MEITEKERLAVKLVELVDKNKERIYEFTSEIMKLENDLNEKNVLKIKQNILGILRALSSVTSSSGYYRLRANRLLTMLSEYSDDRSESNPLFKKNEHLVFWLDHFCTEVNTWNPIEVNITDKGTNITVNFPKTLNIASIVNYLKGKD